MRQQLQSRSVGDLRGGLEQKSLTWDDQKPAVGTAPEGESGERKEGRGVGSSRRGRREESTDVKAKDEGGGWGFNTTYSILQTAYHMLTDIPVPLHTKVRQSLQRPSKKPASLHPRLSSLVA